MASSPHNTALTTSSLLLWNNSRPVSSASCRSEKIESLETIPLSSLNHLQQISRPGSATVSPQKKSLSRPTSAVPEIQKSIEKEKAESSGEAYIDLMKSLQPFIHGKKISIFFMRAYENNNLQINEYIRVLAYVLKKAGLTIHLDILGDDGGLPVGGSVSEYQKLILDRPYVMTFYSKKFYERLTDNSSGLREEYTHLKNRLKTNKNNNLFFIPVMMEYGEISELSHPLLEDRLAIAPFNKENKFCFNVLMQEILKLFKDRIFKDNNEVKKCLEGYIERTPFHTPSDEGLSFPVSAVQNDQDAETELYVSQHVTPSTPQYPTNTEFPKRFQHLRVLSDQNSDISI